MNIASDNLTFFHYGMFTGFIMCLLLMLRASPHGDKADARPMPNEDIHVMNKARAS